MVHATGLRYILDDASGITSSTGGNVVLDFVDPDGAGAATLDLQRRYLYGEAVDQILSQEDLTQLINSPSRILWPLTDHLGTVRDLVRNDSSIATHFVYDSFGAILTGNTALTRYLFTSREFDADTNLQTNRARYYDAATGRWLSHDPLSFAAGDTNTYRYVGNNVTNLIDPSGLVDDVWLGVGAEPTKPEIKRTPPTKLPPTTPVPRRTPPVSAPIYPNTGYPAVHPIFIPRIEIPDRDWLGEKVDPRITEIIWPNRSAGPGNKIDYRDVKGSVTQLFAQTI